MGPPRTDGGICGYVICPWDDRNFRPVRIVLRGGRPSKWPKSLTPWRQPTGKIPKKVDPELASWP